MNGNRKPDSRDGESGSELNHTLKTYADPDYITSAIISTIGLIATGAFPSVGVAIAKALLARSAVKETN